MYIYVFLALWQKKSTCSASQKKVSIFDFVKEFSSQPPIFAFRFPIFDFRFQNLKILFDLPEGFLGMWRTMRAQIYKTRLKFSARAKQ